MGAAELPLLLWVYQQVSLLLEHCQLRQAVDQPRPSIVLASCEYIAGCRAYIIGEP
jgi:hypothetical protein